MDLSLLITLGIIFAATLLGSALRASAKDRCLRDFVGYQVIAERLDGRIVWGGLQLFASGLELSYLHDVVDEQRHIETSFVLYKAEYDSLQALYRYADDLLPENKKRRDASCRQAFHPRLPRYLWRQLRNLMNTAGDSFTEAINLALGRTKVMTSQLVLAQGQTQLKGLTKNMLGYVGTSYDDLLESLIGGQVVVEVTQDEATYEYVGVFRDYTSAFLELLDVFFPQEVELVVRGTEEGELQRGGLMITHRGGELTIVNQTEYPAVLLRVSWAQGNQQPHAILNPGGQLRYMLPAEADEATLTCRLVRQLDMILPRSHALVRHRAEHLTRADALRRPIDAILAGERSIAHLQPRRTGPDGQEGHQALKDMLLGDAPLPSAARRLAETYAKRQELDVGSGVSEEQGRPAPRARR